MKFGTEAIKLVEQLGETCAKVNAPLSEDQRAVCVGALCILLEKFAERVEWEMDERCIRRSGP